MVRLAASGLCHSDEHVRVGDLPMQALPTIGGMRAPASSRR
jgi:S-(hydroxymethyl)glutathione dehydrogenase/alcohol dehydrogenase